jgi:hypothetical protein
MALMIAVAAITRANWRNICPVIPGKNDAGKNTAVSTRVMPSTGPVSSLIALIAGILILLMPRLLNYVVAIYLIAIGILGLAHHLQ